MIIAIDETGDLSPNSKRFNFFTAIRLHQKEALHEAKKKQFFDWERSIPSSIKNHKGEIKSSILDHEYLHNFVEQVVISDPTVGITPVCFIPKNNPIEVIEKHKSI